MTDPLVEHRKGSRLVEETGDTQVWRVHYAFYDGIMIIENGRVIGLVKESDNDKNVY